ncbi:MAG: hypothetical protein A2946_04080 [Candidatus Liptonbacteria bacterium RIFCSPLOWO2_01_FULL_53_13]|uniref:Uncharacterized protein n=1 Tax=Candidatus Liptonbacteria bacterium RIFCSPLOWO2_01_FULL_53_13 TaxID=1798651 RepID=A0A1G2CMZ9_9BACT|nr:MAG: hypothetical protein A2946_04080 [Candidatus Liptonbacteria bacterium RIFCSPLOWO2_01_FULL_53_13]
MADSSEKNNMSKHLVNSSPSAYAIFRKGFPHAKWGRAEGATLKHSPRRIQIPKWFSTLLTKV